MVKNPPANVVDSRDAGSIPGLGRLHGVKKDNLLQYSCLENSMDRGAWRAHGFTKSWTRLQLTHSLFEVKEAQRPLSTKSSY